MYAKGEFTMLYNYNDDNDTPKNADDYLSHEDPISYTNKQKKKRNRVIPITIFTSAVILVGVVSGATVYGLDRYLSEKESTKVAQVETVKDNNEAGKADNSSAQVSTVATNSNSAVKNVDVSNVVSNVMPSIVSVTNSAYISNNGDFFGFGEYGMPGNPGQSQEGSTEKDSKGKLQEASAGTGIIVKQTNDTLYVVTNYHVIEGADKLSITFNDEKTVDCEVKGSDSDADLAVLAVPIKNIPSETLSKIKVAVLGNSEKVAVGEASIAIGNALGYGQSVTTGVISAVAREVQLTDSTMTLLQTDAAINPGNSGGALLNAKGEVIGINTVKYSSEEVEGMGYAIPISDASPIIDELIKAETIPENEQGYLGITGVDIDARYQELYGMPAGAYVSSVVEGSPADKAGIKEGVIITKIADKKVTSMQGLSNSIKKHRAGDKIELTIAIADNGSYSEKTVSVTLGSKAKEQ
ncbi:PDZ domain-containing protein [Anaerosacchariphilus polymeriproducens]|uniref:PDZ domain-containing protein n=2 Tax=Anaerosacchariphilus polymeriproducens TaxID=1812858 RepID=A0A371AWL6_9FIRM|nr:PDZ domain-containing protein [Anaerosacchariphilus polymeriproducens]